MSYSTPKLPRVIFGLIGGSILALFALALVAEFGPRLYSSYQLSRLQDCETESGLVSGDKRANFGFDAGGWHVIGDEPRKRAYIQCARDGLGVQTSEYTKADPVIEVAWHSARYNPTVSVIYYPANSQD